MQHASFDVHGLSALRNPNYAKSAQGVQETARQFETLFLQTLMKSMRASVGENTFLSSDAEKMYTSLLDQERASMMANTKGGLGFAKSIEKQLARQMGVNLNDENQTSKKTEKKEENNNENNYLNLNQIKKENNFFPTLNIFSKDFQKQILHPNNQNQFVEKNNHLENKRIQKTNPFLFNPLFEVADFLNHSQNILENKNIEKNKKNNALTVEKNQNINISNDFIRIQPESFPKNHSLPEYAQNFIQSVFDDAQKVALESGLNPAHIIAHAALESGWGKYQPGGKNNPSFNLFGVKANSSWAGKRVLSKTLEFENGTMNQKYESFRAYNSYQEAFLDYAEFLQNNPRYAEVFNAQNGKDFALELQKAGYATDPNYAQKLQQTIAKTEAFLNISI